MPTLNQLLLLPREQEGFWHGWLIIDQATLLTQEIEDRFLAKKKATAVFVNLTAAYNTVWHCGLTCRLLCFLPDRHMVLLIMKLVQNQSFSLTVCTRK